MSQQNAAVALDPHRQYVIGTAGHIDHGKTALVKALTGIDTDRLPEEKARGITIDLGFAHLSNNVTIIDVPGHERLIKNMVAGVSTIDLVLFVVAADDGVMPQTREHLDIINLLQIRHGIFVITKCDLAESEWLMLVQEELRNLLQETAFASAPILHTSAARGEGIGALKSALLAQLAAIPARQDYEVFRQPVDRVFSAKGFGTVITGTVLSGTLKNGDAVELQPTGLAARVRGLQTHDQAVEQVQVGFRSAVNLAGVETEQVARGMVLVTPDLYQPVQAINARISVLKSAPLPLKNNQRLRIHIHTAETFARLIIPSAARINPGEEALVQLRLEQPIHAAFQDRFIIRQYSPQRTLGGGVVLQVNPFRYRKRHAELFKESLLRLESEETGDRILGAFDRLGARPLRLWDVKVATNLPLTVLEEKIREMCGSGDLFPETLGGKKYYFSGEQLALLLNRMTAILSKYHQRFPGRPGLTEAELCSQMEKNCAPEAARKAIKYGVREKHLTGDGKYFRLAAFSPALSEVDSAHYQQLETIYREGRFAPPTVKEAMSQLQLSQKEFKELVRLLREEEKLIYVDQTLLFHSSVIPLVAELLRDYFRNHPSISVPQFKDLIGTTRKHAIPLLEYLDKTGFTERHGDERRPGQKLS